MTVPVTQGFGVELNEISFVRTPKSYVVSGRGPGEGDGECCALVRAG